MDISIVIPNYNRKDSLRQCLESLFKQDYPQENFEIIVIDDGSRDGTEEILKELSKEHHNLRYFFQQHKGPAAARNLGIEQAKAKIIGFADNDCIVKSNWIRRMLEAHDSEDNVMAVGGLTKVNHHNIKAAVSQFLIDNAIKTDINGQAETIFFPTCNVSLNKGNLNGELFNELFPLPAGEDLELFWRFYKKGNRFIYRQDIEIFHNCHSSFKSFLRQAYMYGRGNYLVQHIHKDHPLLKEIKTKNCVSFLSALIVNFLKIPRFSYVLGSRLIRAYSNFNLYEKFQIYLYFALHKVVYLIGNIIEYIRVSKINRAFLQKDHIFVRNSPVKPEFIILDITHRCNLNCNICEIRKDRPIEEFTTAEVKDLILQSIEWGVKEFVLSGGEPFVRDDIFEILDFVKKKKYRIGILTNGVILDEGFIKRLLPYLTSGTLSLSISLDAITAEIHDDIRGAKGCFEKTLNGLRILSESKRSYPNINFNVISIILNENLEELLTLVNILKSLNVNSIQFQPLLANNLIMKERSSVIKYWIPQERLAVLDRAIDSLVEFKKHNPHLVRNSENNLSLVKKYFRGTLNQNDVRCLYATNTILIANNGDVTTCFGTYGNVRRADLMQVWNSEEIKHARQRVEGCKNPCLLPCFTDNCSENLEKNELSSSRAPVFKITQLQIESTNKCNLRCSICWHALGEIKEYGELAFNDFKKIIDQFNHLEGINLQGLGEPFLTRDIFSMIEYAKRRNITVWLTSNATLLNEDISRKIITSGLSLLRVSIDACQPELYRKIKVGSDINKVIVNINNLNRLKKELNSQTPRLAINSVVLKSTVGELENLIRLAYDLAIDEVSLIPLVVFDMGMATREESMFFHKEVFEQAIYKAGDLAKSLSIALVSGISMEQHPEVNELPQRDLPQCLNKCYINYKGDLSPCCNITSFSFGNMLRISFDDLWNSHRYKNFRDYILKNRPSCRKCNRDIEQLKILD